MGRKSDMVLAVMDEARGSGHRVRAPCPFCAKERGFGSRPALSVDRQTGWFICFRCETKGRLDGFEDAEPPEIIARTVGDVELPYGFHSLHSRSAAHSSYTAKEALDYLIKGRGLSQELIDETGTGFAYHGEASGRVIVPFYHPKDRARTLGWVGRKYKETGFGPKYIYPDDLPRGQILYNAEQLRIPTMRPLWVVEGAFDVMGLWPDAVAVLGKPSQEHIEMLYDAMRPVVFVFDGDAWELGLILAMKLRLDEQEAGYVRLPPTIDPDEVPRSWILQKSLESLASPDLLP